MRSHHSCKRNEQKIQKPLPLTKPHLNFRKSKPFPFELNLKCYYDQNVTSSFVCDMFNTYHAQFQVFMSTRSGII